MRKIKALTANEVRRACELKDIGVLSAEARTYSESSLFHGLGQDRFDAALMTCVCSSDPTHNVFVLGVSGQAGFETLKEKIELIIRLRKEQTKDAEHPFALPAPNDWCYLFNFSAPRMPLPIPFKRGAGEVFKKKMQLLLKELHKEVPRAIASKEVLRRIWQERQSTDMWTMEQQGLIAKEASEYGLGVSSLSADSSEPPTIFPLGKTVGRGGEPRQMTDEEEAALSEEERASLNSNIKKIAMMINAFIGQFNQRAGETNQTLYEVRKAAAAAAIESLFERLNVSEAMDNGEASDYVRFLVGLKRYAVDNFFIFGKQPEPRQFNEMIGLNQLGRDPFLPWEVNVLVDNSTVEDVPIVAERVGSFSELLGFIDPVNVIGGALVDHTRIVAGALHQANDGFLIINVRNILMVPGLWELLKRAIKTRQIKIESLASSIGYDTPRLQPIPVPFNARVILFGAPEIMQLLMYYDEEFLNLFKIRAEIKTSVARTTEQISAFGAWMQWLTQQENIPSFSKQGIAAVIEHAGRIAHHGMGSQEKLSTDIAALESIIKEAALHAEKENAKNISREHVERALKEMFWRSDLAYEHLREWVDEGTILLSREGSAVGQVNGLYVSSRGDIEFGFSTRITAQVSLGTLGLVNIQYDVGLGGKLLDKAGKTIHGLLWGQFARMIPLALNVHVSFEQTYSMMDGDSASVAQYLAIVSDITRIPFKQSIAVTGSLNLRGEVQPIGGVNQKIEGFFDICAIGGGLTGEQGVVIPWQNKKDLMLRPDVVQAVREKKFHIWAVRTVDEAIEIFTDMKAPAFKDAVVKSLKEFSTAARKFSRSK